MTLERFEQLMDTFGTNTSNWPERERRAGAELLSSSEEARRLYESGERLQRILGSGLALTPSPKLQREVAEVPAREKLHERSSLLLSGPGGFWRPLASVLGSVVVGVCLGWAIPESTAEFEDEMFEISEVAFSSALLEELE